MPLGLGVWNIRGFQNSNWVKPVGVGEEFQVEGRVRFWKRLQKRNSQVQLGFGSFKGQPARACALKKTQGRLSCLI